MKKVFVFASLLCVLFGACNTKTPEQAAQESLEQEMKENEASQMRHERYIDSLVNVASGLDGESLISNRRHALSILRSEYPQLSEKWDKMEVSINNCEVYGDDD